MQPITACLNVASASSSSDSDLIWVLNGHSPSRPILQALKWSQRPDGEYWKRHGIEPTKTASITTKPKDGTLPWHTVRDALANLPEPLEGGCLSILNHELRAGARTYPGHTGSILDMPSKTLKAGVHGVPGGENMLIRDDDTPRYYSIREAGSYPNFPRWIRT